MQRQKCVRETKRESVWLENSGQRRERRVRQGPDHAGPCGTFGRSSLPPSSLPSFLSFLAVYPVAEPLSDVLGTFEISQLLVFMGGTLHLAINLKTGKTCSPSFPCCWVPVHDLHSANQMHKAQSLNRKLVIQRSMNPRESTWSSGDAASYPRRFPGATKATVSE